MRLLVLVSLMTALWAMAAEPIKQAYKKCFTGKDADPCGVVYTGEAPVLVEYVSVVCKPDTRLHYATLSVQSDGKVVGSHGVPLSSTPWQGAGNVKLVLKPKSKLGMEFAMTPGAWCEFTATYSALK
jgi:hypothetical protein